MTSATGPAHLHAALLYRSAEHLASAVVPFLADGLAAGEAVVLACREENSALLAEALGHDDRILVLPRDGIYTQIAHVIATLPRVVRRQLVAGASGVRLLGEIPVDQSGDEWHEWHRCEAISNVALGPLPLSSVCAYDRRELSDAIGTRGVNLFLYHAVIRDRYADLAALLARITSSDDDARQVGAQQLTVAALGDPALDAHVDALLGGDHVGTRAAVTEVAADNLPSATRSARCAALLTAAFHDAEQPVRDEARRAFYHLTGQPLEQHADLLRAYAAARPRRTTPAAC
jgi:hypothetical protein